MMRRSAKKTTATEIASKPARTEPLTIAHPMTKRQPTPKASKVPDSQPMSGSSLLGAFIVSHLQWPTLRLRHAGPRAFKSDREARPALLWSGHVRPCHGGFHDSSTRLVTHLTLAFGQRAGHQKRDKHTRSHTNEHCLD